MSTKTTVEMYFEIDEHKLDEMRDEDDDSDYWYKCWNFYRHIKYKPIDHLSKEQRDWLLKIEWMLGKFEDPPEYPEEYY